MATTAIDTDILIAGGGPCGLMLANELGRRGMQAERADLVRKFAQVTGHRTLAENHA